MKRAALKIERGQKLKGTEPEHTSRHGVACPLTFHGQSKSYGQAPSQWGGTFTSPTGKDGMARAEREQIKSGKNRI